ncbi:MAG: aminopeptidase P family protein [Lachnospiraceae bacterium]|nr:aminopeptidase P family protein [Lachnospiraceae bacterium]
MFELARKHYIMYPKMARSAFDPDIIINYVCKQYHYVNGRKKERYTMGNICSERVDRLRQLMERDGLDYYIVYTSDSHMSEYPDDYYKFRDYLSGFTGSSGTLLIGRKGAILWTDGRYYIQAEKELDGSGIELYKQEAGTPDLKEYLTENAAGKVIGVDGSHISEESYEELVAITGEGGRVDNGIDYAEEIWEDRPQKTRNPIKMIPDRAAGKNMNEKIREVLEKVAEYKADGIIVTDLADVMWIFNIRGSDIRYSPLAYSYAFITRNKTLLYIDRKAACNELYAVMSAYGNMIRPYEDIYTSFNFPEKARIICDKKLINSALYGELSANNEMIDVDHTKIIRKAVKNKAEIKYSKKYHVQDGLAVCSWIYDIKKRVKAGERPDEYEAAMYADELRKKIRGNMGPSFKTICAYKENGAVIHYAPHKGKAKKLSAEGFLLLDSGGQYTGATTDITRTIALGPLSKEMKEDYTLVLKGHLRLMSLVFLKGCSGENLDVIARAPIWERYVDYKHGTGHGVGSNLSVHEGPQAIRYNIKEGQVQPPIEEGMITSDEPGIYHKGKYGIRLENLLLCVLKKKNEWGTFLGFEPLSLVPFEREAIIPEMLESRELETLNSYHSLVYEALKDGVSGELSEWLSEACAPIGCGE